MSEEDYSGDTPDNSGDTQIDTGPTTDPGFSYDPPGIQAEPDLTNWGPDPVTGDFTNPYEAGVPAPIGEPQFSRDGTTPPTAEEQQAAVDKAIQDLLGGGYSGHGAFTPEEEARVREALGIPTYEGGLPNVTEAGGAPPGSPESQTNVVSADEIGPGGKFLSPTFDAQGNIIGHAVGTVGPGGLTEAMQRELNGGKLYNEGDAATGPDAGGGGAPAQPGKITEHGYTLTGTDTSDPKNWLNIATGKTEYEMRQGLKAAGFPDWNTASDTKIADVYAKAAAGGAVKPTKGGSQLGDYQKYIDALVKSNQQRREDMLTQQEKENQRADRAQKIGIVAHLLALSQGPNGPRNYRLALALIQSLGNLTPSEQAMFAAAQPRGSRNLAAAVGAA